MRERLEDAEKLRLFSRVASEKQKALESSLEEAQAASQALVCFACFSFFFFFVIIWQSNEERKILRTRLGRMPAVCLFL